MSVLDELDEIAAVNLENEEYLKLFQDSLQGLSRATINRHMTNADLFLNEYLANLDAIPMQYGISEVPDFIGDFFIRKCSWSTPDSVRALTTSLKKFYRCMVDHGKISKEKYNELCAIIRKYLPRWVRASAARRAGF